jgi:hypothetical protein
MAQRAIIVQRVHLPQIADEPTSDMKKPEPTARQTKEADTLSLVLQTLAVMAILIGASWGLYLWLQAEPSEPILVEVTLDNQCSVINQAFMAVSEPDGAKVYFDGPTAVLLSRTNSKVYVRNSDKYPSFYFESPRVDPAKKVTITAVCDRGERIERTLDALRKQFQ